MQKTKKFGCPRCNYSTKEKIKINSSEKIEERKEIAIVKGKESPALPITSAVCRKCKNDKAYFWIIQTRAGDEAETKFFKCTNPKCEYTWREYR